MKGLGFGGYGAQGGDMGHQNARLMAERFEVCKGALRPQSYGRRNLDS